MPVEMRVFQSVLREQGVGCVCMWSSRFLVAELRVSCECQCQEGPHALCVILSRARALRARVQCIMSTCLLRPLGGEVCGCVVNEWFVLRRVLVLGLFMCPLAVRVPIASGSHR